MKVTMNLNDELVERIDKYAKTNYMTRTSVISFAASQFLMTQEVPALMSNINQAMIKIAQTGEITEEQRKLLDSMEVFVELLQAGKINQN